jgi:hypothetical protein
MSTNYIKIFKLISLLTFPSFASSAQMITFEKHYYTDYDKSGKDILPTDDGGYLIAGTTENNNSSDLDIHVIKTDAYGEIMHTNTFGGDRVEYPNGMIKTSDNNFFIVGYTQSEGGGDMDVYLNKVNQNGDLLFTKVYGGFGNEEGNETIATNDGNYLIAGASNSVDFANNNMMLIKIALDGTEIWTRYYGGPDYESARSVKLCTDGGFILTGKTAKGPSAIASLQLVKTNSSGQESWTKTYSGGTHSYEGKFILANSDGSYTVCVDDSSQTNDSDVMIMKFDNSGGLSWSKNYGGDKKDIGKMIQSTTDGGYIVGAISRSFGWNNPDVWILKLDSTGESQWTRHFGGSGHEHLYSIRQTDDGGYIAIGHARSYSQNWEVYFLKLNEAGAVGIEEFASNDPGFNLFPNPSSGIINIDWKDGIEFSVFKISNALGEVIYQESAENINKGQTTNVDLKDQRPGMYFVTIETPLNSITKKLILN